MFTSRNFATFAPTTAFEQLIQSRYSPVDRSIVAVASLTSHTEPSDCSAISSASPAATNDDALDRGVAGFRFLPLSSVRQPASMSRRSTNSSARPVTGRTPQLTLNDVTA